MLKFILFLMLMFFLKKKFWLMKELMFLFFILFFTMMIPSFYSFLYFSFFIDFLSYSLLSLTFWIMGLMILSSEKINYLMNYKNLFLLILIFLLLFLFLSFSVLNFFMFYLFFEMSLIPTIFLILGWGYQPERIMASMYLLFYTLLVSLPLLLSIFFFYSKFMFLNFNLINIFILFNNNWILYFTMIMAFLVKMPMFLVHLWLPKAHVEAPISGSMILAGILLKLGGYGLLRILVILLKINIMYMYYLILISLWGGILVSLSCLCQIDFKSLIAYSSVVHMSLILASMFNFYIWSFNSSLLMMISHGLCSSGLFYLANISYERIMNRSMLISKGMLNLMPSLSLWWFLLLSSNMAAPPSLNLLSEIGLLNSIMNWQISTFLLLMLLSFFSASYCLYLFSFSQHGSSFSLLFSFSNSLIREFLILFLHWLPLNLLILKSEFFILSF